MIAIILIIIPIIVSVYLIDQIPITNLQILKCRVMAAFPAWIIIIVIMIVIIIIVIIITTIITIIIIIIVYF